jgi:hypothetical protein
LCRTLSALPLVEHHRPLVAALTAYPHRLRVAPRRLHRPCGPSHRVELVFYLGVLNELVEGSLSPNHNKCEMLSQIQTEANPVRIQRYSIYRPCIARLGQVPYKSFPFWRPSSSTNPSHHSRASRRRRPATPKIPASSHHMEGDSLPPPPTLELTPEPELHQKPPLPSTRVAQTASPSPALHRPSPLV